jgi:hypothetical protein
MAAREKKTRVHTGRQRVIRKVCQIVYFNWLLL